MYSFILPGMNCALSDSLNSQHLGNNVLLMSRECYQPHNIKSACGTRDVMWVSDINKQYVIPII